MAAVVGSVEQNAPSRPQIPISSSSSSSSPTLPLMEEDVEGVVASLSRNQLIQLLQLIRQQAPGLALIRSALSQLHRGGEGDGQHGGGGGGGEGGPPSLASSPAKDNKRRKKQQQQQKEFDFSKHSSRQIALQLAYDGDNYSGFASQGDRPEETVEKHLLAALEKTKLIKDREWARYSRCGRTDKGVSALRQVVGLRVRSNRPKKAEDEVPCGIGDDVKGTDGSGRHEEEEGEEEVGPPSLGPVDLSAKGVDESVEGEMDYCTVLNRVLPPDIRVLGWAPVPHQFSARFCASYRTYRYFFNAEGVDVSKMGEAASLLVGDHDFRNLCKMDATAVSNFRRVIHYAHISTVGQWVWSRGGTEGGDGSGNGPPTAMSITSPAHVVCCLEIRGQAFLWHMVRCIMAVLYMVGRGLEEPSIIAYLLDVDACPRKPPFVMASEEPLVLHDCGFQGLGFHYQPEAVLQLWRGLKQQWSRLAVRLARVENMMEMLAEVEMSGREVEAWARGLREGGKGKGCKTKTRCPDVEDGDGGTRDSGGVMVWREVMAKYLVGSSSLVLAEERGRTRGGQHVPLKDRPGEKTYEERVAEMTGKRKERFEENKSKRQQAPPDEIEVHKRYRTTLEVDR